MMAVQSFAIGVIQYLRRPILYASIIHYSLSTSTLSTLRLCLPVLSRTRLDGLPKILAYTKNVGLLTNLRLSRFEG